MKFKIPILLFFAFSSMVSAQEIHPYNHYDHHDQQSYLKWGDDYYYNKSLKGLGSLMTDLRTLDPELYQTLDPQYKALSKKQREASMIVGIGGGIGGIMLIAGFIPRISESEYEYLGQTGTLETAKMNVGLIISGTVVAIGSVIVGSAKWVRSQDILEFTNRFNQYTKGEKLHISMRPAIGFENGPSAGLSLCLGF